MALARGEPQDPRLRLVALALAAGVPGVGYLATASAHGYWLDGDEFIAASVGLGVSHPPGQPLAALVGAGLGLVPIGSLSFRIAVASALAAAAAALLLFRAIDWTVRSLGIVADGVAVPLALGATWLVAGSHGFWFQAVRPEVYALQAVLVFGAIERLVAFEARWPTTDVRPLYTAALMLGLGMANHHLLAFLVLPAMAPSVARVWRTRGARSVGWLALGVTAGLTTYLYLPLRAATSPPLNLGNPTSLERLFWVVSAKVYQTNQGTHLEEPMFDRFADVAVGIVETLHWLPVLLALCGSYVLLRAPGARRVGAVWVAVLLVFCAARGWLGFVRSNPDALGYLIPALGAFGALAAAFVAAVLSVVAGATEDRPPRRAVVASLLLAVLGFAQLYRTIDRSTLAAFADNDGFTEVDRRTLPSRAVLLLHDPQTAFRWFGARASQGLRPDVVPIPLPFLNYPGVANALADQHPELGPLLRAYLLDGHLEPPELQNLSRQRPVQVELDVRVPPSLYSSLVPGASYFRVLTDRAYAEDRRPGRLASDKGWQLLGRVLRRELDVETQRRLLWRSYNDALYYASVGEFEAARIAADRGLALFPQAQPLRGLRAATEGGTPFDVAPFRL